VPDVEYIPHDPKAKPQVIEIEKLQGTAKGRRGAIIKSLSLWIFWHLKVKLSMLQQTLKDFYKYV